LVSLAAAGFSVLAGVAAAFAGSAFCSSSIRRHVLRS
jgi:hypothetical protein